MSWKINLVGTDSSTIPEAVWKDVDSSGITGPYVSGLSFEWNGIETDISNVSAANPAVVESLSVPIGLADGDIIHIVGPSTPAEYGDLLDDYPYYRVDNLSIGPTMASFSPQFLDMDTYGSEIEFEALGCQPKLMDESIEVKYWAGGYRRIKRARLAFEIVIYPFTTRGDFYSGIGNSIYWGIQEVLKHNNIFITTFGSDFERMFELMNLYPSSFALPLQVEVMSFGELAADFEGNKDRLNITLVSTEWFTFN